MVEKLEELYLNILRFAVVIVAGLSLIVVVASLFFAGTSLLPSMLNKQSDISGGNLKEFIDEQKQTAQFEVTDGEEADSTLSSKYESPFIKEAVDITFKYLKKIDNGDVDRTALVEAFESQLGEIEYAYQEDFKRSMLTLLRQLSKSKGKPLSLEKLDELIQWHNEKFNAEVMSMESQSAIDDADSWGWLTMAGSAFLVFIVIAFYFLFVRVERHLRLVNIISSEPVEEAEA